MRVECRRCGERVGQAEALSCTTVLVRITMPLLLGGIVLSMLPSLPHAITDAALLALGLWFLGVYAILWFVFPEGMMWLRALGTRCPNCGARRWSRGFYESFRL